MSTAKLIAVWGSKPKSPKKLGKYVGHWEKRSIVVVMSNPHLNEHRVTAVAKELQKELKEVYALIVQA